MEYQKEFEKCAVCGNSDLIRDYESSELICSACGCVVSSKSVDRGPEWRAFNLEQMQKRSRTGSPTTWSIHDKGLSTKIDWRNRDAHGRRLKPDQRSKLYRMRKWHRRSTVSGSSGRNLSKALSLISKMANDLHLPKSVVETASLLYHRIVRRKLVQGRSIRSVAAASLYMACRQCDVIRSLEEVADSANITKKEESSSYRFILRKLDVDVPPFDPGGFVSKYVKRLSLPGEAEFIALEFMSSAQEARLTSGRSPSGVASAAVYIACKLTGNECTQHEIAAIAGVTEVTIRNRYKEMVEELEIKVEI